MSPLARLAAFALALGAGLAFAATTLDAAQTAAETPQPTRLSWLSPPGDPARGKELGQVCLSCHSESSPQTQPAAPKLHRQRQSYMFFALAAFRDGDRESPIMGPMVQGMSDQDLRDVAAFLSGTLLDKPPMPQSESAAYRRVLKDCTWCHGETGIGEFEGMPVLAGQDPAYLANALEEYRKGIRHDPTMRGVAAKLTPADEKMLADYFAQYAWLEKHK